MWGGQGPPGEGGRRGPAGEGGEVGEPRAARTVAADAARPGVGLLAEGKEVDLISPERRAVAIHHLPAHRVDRQPSGVTARGAVGEEGHVGEGEQRHEHEQCRQPAGDGADGLPLGGGGDPPPHRTGPRPPPPPGAPPSTVVPWALARAAAERFTMVSDIPVALAAAASSSSMVTPVPTRTPRGPSVPL